MVNLIIAFCGILPIALWKDFTTFEFMICIYLFAILLTLVDIKNK